MQILIDYWMLIVACIAVVAVGGYAVYVFVKKPTGAQLQSVKEWMLLAVTKAEKELGSGTGKLKLRYVYDMFITKFPWLTDTVSFEMVSMMVDDALNEMKELLTTNKAISEYVNGTHDDYR